MLWFVHAPESDQFFVLTSEKLLRSIKNLLNSHSLLYQSEMQNCLVSWHHCCVMLQDLHLGLELPGGLRFCFDIQKHCASTDIIPIDFFICFEYFHSKTGQITSDSHFRLFPLNVYRLHHHNLIGPILIRPNIALLLEPNLPTPNQPRHHQSYPLHHIRLQNAHLKWHFLLAQPLQNVRSRC